MRKRILALLFSAAVFLSVLPLCSAADFSADSEGKYTIEYITESPNTEYMIVVVAGDYTDKNAPEISEDNIIYINQAVSDENGKITLSDFIPLTDSVGTVFISGAEQPENAGLLMTDSGLGFVAGRIISYSADSETVFIPSDITVIEDGVVIDAENVILPSGNFSASANAFLAGTKLFFSPVAKEAKQYAIANGYAYRVFGDYDGDSNVDMDDMTGILTHFAKNADEEEDFLIYFDLDLSGSVTLRDAAILLEFLGGKIADFSDDLKT